MRHLIEEVPYYKIQDIKSFEFCNTAFDKKLLFFKKQNKLSNSSRKTDNFELGFTQYNEQKTFLHFKASNTNVGFLQTTIISTVLS